VYGFEGEEGFRADETSSSDWTVNGYEGTDFVRNTAISDIDFATNHIYPTNFNVPVSGYGAFLDSFMSDRASIAKTIGKPIILEEYGEGKNCSMELCDSGSICEHAPGKVSSFF
jgi:mannan endo-1,4-beta-mannosidase